MDGDAVTAAVWVDKPGINNWVDEAGGLPPMIKRVAKHLMDKGFSQSHAIATAVNVVKKWCRGVPDGLNFPRVQRVTPATRAQGCKAVAEWEAKRARARSRSRRGRG